MTPERRFSDTICESLLDATLAKLSKSKFKVYPNLSHSKNQISLDEQNIINTRLFAKLSILLYCNQSTTCYNIFRHQVISQLIIIPLKKGIMFFTYITRFVCLSVCVSVCLSSRLRRDGWT